jgi:hypothetical protein
MKGIHMPRYDVTAWCSFPHYTTFEVEADTAQDALAKAETQVLDEYPEPCNGGEYQWDEFQIDPADDNEPGIYHLQPEARLSAAAQTLLDALRCGVTAATDVVTRWEKGDLAQAVRALSLWATEAAAAVERAAGVPGEASWCK